VRRGYQQQRVTIRRRLGDCIGANLTSRGRTIVDDHRLAQRLLEMRRDQPRHHIIGAAGRERHDEPQGMSRKGLRGGGRCRERG
jgi:hypothetical protein